MRLCKSPASKGAGSSPCSPPLPWTDRLLLTLALIAGIAVTAYSEWQLALQVGIHPAVAPLFPVSIDVYLIASVRAGQGRDIAASLLVMGGAQVSAHLLSTDVVSVSIPLVAAVSLLVPVTVWRVHALARAGSEPEPVLTQPMMSVSRAGEPVAEPAMAKIPAPTVELPQTAVSAAETPRQDVVTLPVKAEPQEGQQSPRRTRSEEIVRGLYDTLGNKRPGTRHLRDALSKAGLPSSDGSCRETRKRVEAAEPELRELPPA
ncbi:hypothetical protein ABZV15_07915 [Streptomyces sp. NPDC005246]|uniref:hypothetical protein n=1 Tax=Streptomyces sp. NPDC005246 TaxID=3156716 RepID=UPI0033A821D9